MTAEAPAKSLGVVRIILSMLVGATVWGLAHLKGDIDPPYLMVDEVIARGDSIARRDLRVHGWVEAGSITTKVIDGHTLRSFILQKDGKRLRVFARWEAVPDNFKDLSEIVAFGRLHERGYFLA